MANSNVVGLSTARTVATRQSLPISMGGMTNNNTIEADLEVSDRTTDIISAFRHRGFSWDDVLESIQIARDEHDEGEGRGKFRNAYKNKALITTLHSLTDMIPDQDGLSVMRGGLKLIFKV